MKSSKPYILTLNGGSSSIKFALYEKGEMLERKLHGKIDRIGQSGAELSFTDFHSQQERHSVLADDHSSAGDYLIRWLEGRDEWVCVQAVGHRVVFGMKHIEPQKVTETLLDELEGFRVYDPNHLPREIKLIRFIQKRHPLLPQIVCFDTAFHRTMPPVASRLPIPRRYGAQGVQRYGFHGLSYAYLIQELGRLVGEESAKGRVILAHLGSGASMAALRNGQSVDTSMAFSPAAGFMMGTRSGDIDPGLVSFLARSEKMTPPQFEQMINHESGLLGLSETSPDVGDLLKAEAGDVRAAEALELFCYQVKKQIGAYAAVLGGLDKLVFAGGIGENAPSIRTRICEGLDFLGIELDESLNTSQASVISAKSSRVEVRVIPTNEELIIAQSVCRTVNWGE